MSGGHSTKKIRVGVLFGGRSGEHEVSLMSARSIVSALDSDRYEITMIGIDRTGKWLTGDVAAALESGSLTMVQRAALLAEPGGSTLMEIDEAGARAVSISEVTQLDVVFPVLHGPYGEDGTVQGLLELADIPYVGAGVVGSAVGMDKAIFKAVMAAHDIPVLPWMLVLRKDLDLDADLVLDKVERDFVYPMFVKPANLGSSVGISKCRNIDELKEGLQEAARYDRRLVIEQGIDARELEVSVLGNEQPIASVIGEVRPRREFYDYIAKYVSDDSELIIPAELDTKKSEEIRLMAVDAFKAMDCAGLGRVDFLLERESERVYINEINTIPGFTRISMYPKLWEATGLAYPDLLDRLIGLALERHADKSRTQTSYEVPEYD